MGLPKGKTNNLKGRPVGALSAKTIQWEELGHSLVTKHSERANAILAACDDDTFMDNYGKLLEYFKPKLARTETKIEGTTEQTIRFVHDNDQTPQSPSEATGISKEEKAIQYP